MSMIRKFGLASLALAAALVAVGCQRTYVAATLETNYPPDDANKELEFWHTLPARSAVCNDEGLHGLVLLADGEDTTGSYPQRVELAKSRGWVSDSFDEPGNLAMQRGTLAQAVCVICQIKGGVVMHVLGPIPRYATRELVYMRLMGDPSTENLAITGLEYMGVISKAQDYMTLRDVPMKVAPIKPQPETEPRRERQPGEPSQ